MIARETGRSLADVIDSTSPFEMRLWKKHFKDVPPLAVMVGGYLGYFDEDETAEDKPDTDLDSAANEYLRQQALARAGKE